MTHEIPGRPSILELAKCVQTKASGPAGWRRWGRKRQRVTLSCTVGKRAANGQLRPAQGQSQPSHPASTGARKRRPVRGRAGPHSGAPIVSFKQLHVRGMEQGRKRKGPALVTGFHSRGKKRMFYQIMCLLLKHLYKIHHPIQYSLLEFFLYVIA